MNQEAKTCQNCKQNFAIEPEDFVFYEKIKVPPPSFCWRCRMQRRNNWRNERSLYKRKCDAPGHNEGVISSLSQDAPCVVYDQKFWWGDGWNPLTYGVEYDFQKTFFDQFKELLSKVPLPPVANVNPVNSDYCNAADSNKNCYLSFAAGYNENVCYSNKIGMSRDSLDCYMATKIELCYENVNCHDSYRLLWGVNSKNCRDSFFLYNCKNCSDCFGCANLNAKSYYIWNEPYSKVDYFEKLKSFDLKSRGGILSFQNKFKNEIALKAIHKYANILSATNCTGDNIKDSKNTKISFDVLWGAEDSKFLQHSFEIKDVYDCMGAYKYNFSYENIDNNFGNNNIATMVTYNATNNRYSFHCHGCNDIFACIGLRNKQYCILNKQYTKEEYEQLVPKIIDHMNTMPYVDKKGRVYKYGEFFPAELSPWAYNETIAQEYFTLSEKEANNDGFRWKPLEEKHHSITLPTSRIQSEITNVPDSIMNEVIGCAHEGKCSEQCTEAFKIIDQELKFYRQLNLPLPNLCPNCRHYQRLKQRNPLKLWHRQCMCDYQVYQNTIKHPHHPEGPCPNEFETSYAPERKEIVYCESCYNAEVA